jgi:hypothetical protein
MNNHCGRVNGRRRRPALEKRLRAGEPPFMPLRSSAGVSCRRGSAHVWEVAAAVVADDGSHLICIDGCHSVEPLRIQSGLLGVLLSPLYLPGPPKTRRGSSTLLLRSLSSLQVRRCGPHRRGQSRQVLDISKVLTHALTQFNSAMSVISRPPISTAGKFPRSSLVSSPMRVEAHDLTSRHVVRHWVKTSVRPPKHTFL